MNAIGFRDRFLTLYDRLASNGAPGYSLKQISAILSLAEENIVYKKAPYVHKNESIRKEVGKLVRPVTLSPSNIVTGLMPNGVYFEIENDVARVYTEIATVESEDECIDNKKLDVKPITLDQYTSNLDNPFEMPNENKVWRIDMGSSETNKRLHQLITNGEYTIKNYFILYLLKPQGIVINSKTDNSQNTDSLTDSSVHNEIVREAVRIATAPTVPEEYQIKLNEQKLTDK